MELAETLMKLSASAGPTGRETETVELAKSLLEPLVDETYVDAMGNLVGVCRCGRENARKILLDAHLDEVAMAVTGCEDGFLTFDIVRGGIDPRLLPGSEVRVLCEPEIRGVVTCLPPHILKKEEQNKCFDVRQLWIDVGGVEVAPGTPVIWATEPVRLGGNRIAGKALDNRAGFAVVLRALELLLAMESRGVPQPADIYVLGSVQEEFSMAGAKTGAFAIDPDVAYVVDVTFGDTPDSKKPGTFPLGSGAVISVGPCLRKSLTDGLKRVADSLNIPHRIEVLSGSTGTNAMGITIAREGIPTAMVSVPLRYMHTPAEVVDLRDLEAAARLLAADIIQGGGAL